ncbi:MAG TPA: NAD-dependent epimerase/dehydratase family protein [Candidatus Polarisedimenticolia bacterium]|nr:NAD-dependent epimerase/dehydratase family protein [Candidatus Polarisedimenticolia bacterium]
MQRKTILITGAAGNLGSRLALSLLDAPHQLRLMVHRTPLPDRLARASGVEVARADLARPETLTAAVAGADVIVHFAGRLFAPRPERFLPETNIRWFSNLTDAALKAGVGRIVLISFPHTEGPTTPDAPARGRLDGTPVSVHAATRRAQEALLLERSAAAPTTPVVLRLGTVYGRGILMVEAARWLARRRLLAVWKEPTWYHFLSTPDFLRATEAAALKEGIQGVYQVADEAPTTLQEFLDAACRIWMAPRPWRAPVWAIYGAASLCELYALAFGTLAPLTRDFITIGRVPHVADTSRARRELVPDLVHPTLETGLSTLA